MIDRTICHPDSSVTLKKAIRLQHLFHRLHLAQPQAALARLLLLQRLKRLQSAPSQSLAAPSPSLIHRHRHARQALADLLETGKLKKIKAAYHDDGTK
jgi:hypothetical protein